MTELPPEVERLASRLDQALPPGMARTPRETSDALVNTALLLARTQVPPLSAEADARIQKRVLTAMRNQTTPRPRPVLVFVRWLAAACLIVVVLTAGLVPLSAEAIPGDLLYPVKRGFEQVELLLNADPEARAQAALTQAERRLNEQNRLIERGQFDAALVQSGLQSLRDAADAANASDNPAFTQQLEQRSVILTLRFAGLMDEADSGASGSSPPPDNEANIAETPVVSPTPTATAAPPQPTLPVLPTAVRQVPLPPGLSTRLAPAAGVIATRVAEPTATCEAGRSCQSAGLPGSGGSTSRNSSANGNAGSGGSSNGNASGNSGNANGASNGGATGNGTGAGAGNSSGNSGNTNGASNGNSDGNASGNNNGNTTGNSNGSTNGAADGSSGNNSGGNNGNSDGNSSNGNANGSSDGNNSGGNSSGNSDGNANNNSNGNSDSNNSGGNSNNNNGGGNSNGNNSNGSSDGGNSNGNANGNSDGNNSNGNSGGGNSNGNANGNSNGNN